MNVKYVVLFAILMLFGMSSHAAKFTAKDNQGNQITLLDEPCVISPWLKDWQQASFRYEGVLYAAYWRLQGDTVVILDSGGDVTPLPMTAFKPEAGV